MAHEVARVTVKAKKKTRSRPWVSEVGPTVLLNTTETDTLFMIQERNNSTHATCLHPSPSSQTCHF